MKIAGTVLAMISGAVLASFLAIMFYSAFIVNFSPDNRPLGKVGCYLGMSGVAGLTVGLILVYAKRRCVKRMFVIISTVIMFIGCALTTLGAPLEGESESFLSIIGFCIVLTGLLVALGCMCLASYVPGEMVKVFVPGKPAEEKWRGVVDHATAQHVWIKRDGREVTKVAGHLVAPVK